MASGALQGLRPAAMQARMRSLDGGCTTQTGTSGSNCLFSERPFPFWRQSLVPPSCAAKLQLGCIPGSSTFLGRSIVPLGRCQPPRLVKSSLACRGSLAEDTTKAWSNVEAPEKQASKNGQTWTALDDPWKESFPAAPLFDASTTPLINPQPPLSDDSSQTPLGELHADTFSQMEALISERDVLGGDHEAFILEAIAKDTVHFLAPQGKRRHLPLFVYLPGLDGTGLFCKQQLGPLLEEFDVRCFVIPTGDTSSIDELADAAAGLIRHERVARQRLAEEDGAGGDVSKTSASAAEMSPASGREGNLGEVGSSETGTGSVASSNGSIYAQKVSINGITLPPEPTWDPSLKPPQTVPSDPSPDSSLNSDSNPSLKPPFPVTVYAESFGTGIALCLASAYPTEVHSLVVLNSITAFRRQPLLKWSSMFLGSVPAGLHDLGSYAIAPLLADWRRMSEESRFLLLPPFSTRVLTPDAVTRRTQMMLGFDPSEADLNQIQASTLLIASGRDRLMPSVEEADWLASRIPDCHVKVLPDSGHVALLEDGICLATLLREAGFAGDRNGGSLGEWSGTAADGFERSTEVSVGSEVGVSAGKVETEPERAADGNGTEVHPIVAAEQNGRLGVKVRDGSNVQMHVGPNKPGPDEGSPESDGQKEGGKENPGRQTEDSDFADALKDNPPERKLRDDLAVQLRTTTRKLSEGLKERKSDGSESGERSSDGSESARNSSEVVESNGTGVNGSERRRSSLDGLESEGKPLIGSGSRRVDDGSSSSSTSGRLQESPMVVAPGLSSPLAESGRKTDNGTKLNRMVPTEEVNRWRRSQKARKRPEASNPIFENDLKWLEGVVSNIFASFSGRETGVVNARDGLQNLDGTAGAAKLSAPVTSLDAENGLPETNGRSWELPQEIDSGTRVVSFLGELSADHGRVNVGESRAERSVSPAQQEASAREATVGSFSTRLETNRGAAVNGTEGKVSLDGAVAAGKPFAGVRSDQPAAVNTLENGSRPSSLSGSSGGEVSGNGRAVSEGGSLQVEGVPGRGSGAEQNGTESAKEWKDSEDGVGNGALGQVGTSSENGAEGQNGVRGAQNGTSFLRGLGAVERDVRARESENGKAAGSGNGRSPLSENGRSTLSEFGKGLESGNGRSTDRVAASATQSSAEETRTVVASSTEERATTIFEGENENGGTVSAAGAGEASPPVAKKAPADLKAGGVAAGRAFGTMLDDMPQYRLWNWLTRPEFYGMDDIPVDAAPLLFVGNHTLFGIYDMPLMMYELRKRRGLALRGLAHEWHWKSPLGDIFEKYGAVKATPRNCFNLLKAGEPVLLYPGGGREVAKRKGEKYKLLWKDDTDFVRLAMKCKATIVPFATVGVEDAFDILMGPDEIMASPLGDLIRPALKATGFTEDVIPSLATGGNLLPRPERLYFNFGEPIYTSHYTRKDLKDKEECARLYKQAKTAVEDGILLLQAKRSKDPLRELLPRAMVNIMEGWDGS